MQSEETKQPAYQPQPGSINQQAVAMAGQQNPLHKNLFEKVKRGDVDEVVRIVRESGIDVSQVIDEPKNFSQTLAFTACIIRDQELALKMVKVLIELGVDP